MTALFSAPTARQGETRAFTAFTRHWKKSESFFSMKQMPGAVQMTAPGAPTI
jgi:hypothetical protein